MEQNIIDAIGVFTFVGVIAVVAIVTGIYNDLRRSPRARCAHVEPGGPYGDPTRCPHAVNRREDVYCPEHDR